MYLLEIQRYQERQEGLKYYIINIFLRYLLLKTGIFSQGIIDIRVKNQNSK